MQFMSIEVLQGKGHIQTRPVYQPSSLLVLIGLLFLLFDLELGAFVSSTPGISS